YLKQRGLNGTERIISDAHAGLISAIRKSFAGESWQRCQVHFMRNILASVPKKDSKPFREARKTIFRFTDIELARTAKIQLLDTYADKTAYKKVCQKLDEGLEDAFQYTVIDDGHR